jgi:hypothetical protein
VSRARIRKWPCAIQRLCVDQIFGLHRQAHLLRTPVRDRARPICFTFVKSSIRDRNYSSRVRQSRAGCFGPEVSNYDSIAIWFALAI